MPAPNTTLHTDEFTNSNGVALSTHDADYRQVNLNAGYKGAEQEIYSNMAAGSDEVSGALTMSIHYISTNDDQSAEGTYAGSSPSSWLQAVFVRAGDVNDGVNDNDAYRGDFNSGTTWRMQRHFGGSATTLDSDTGPANPSVGTLSKMESIGTDVKMYRDSVEILSAVDASISSGYGGLGAHEQTTLGLVGYTYLEIRHFVVAGNPWNYYAQMQ